MEVGLWAQKVGSLGVLKDEAEEGKGTMSLRSLAFYNSSSIFSLPYAATLDSWGTNMLFGPASYPLSTIVVT